jgi:hypothetical protein
MAVGILFIKGLLDFFYAAIYKNHRATCKLNWHNLFSSRGMPKHIYAFLY